jgi:adenosylcobyric acid synthase
VSDLDWLRSTGLADAVRAAAGRGVPVLGICGGFQMLGDRIVDEVESGAGEVTGLGLLPVSVTFHADKVLATTAGQWRGCEVTGYQIHHGVATVAAGPEAFRGGVRVGTVWGTKWHGAFENDGFRRAWLTATTGYRADPAATGFRARREAMLDRLADAVEQHLDAGRLLDLVGA